MSPLVKVVVAAAGGAFLSKYIEPHIQGFVKTDSEMGKAAIAATSVGIAAGGIYYVLGKGA